MENNLNNNVANDVNTAVNAGVVNNDGVTNTVPTPIPTVVSQVSPASTVVADTVTPVNVQPINQSQVVNQVPVQQVPVQPVQPAATVVNSNQPVMQNVAPVVTPGVNSTIPNIPVTTINSNGNGDNVEEKNMKQTYILIGVIVGLVLVIAGILLYFLLNGSIANRNRYTCTKTTQEDGYEQFIKRYYTLDNNVMVRVYYTHEFRYNDELTDDMYNQTYGDIINNDTNGITRYGLNTSIQKDDDTVIISSYEPNYFSENVKDIEKNNKEDGFTCK